ncbi:hypothetical protein ACF07L_03490 [Streptomyces anulatus]
MKPFLRPALIVIDVQRGFAAPVYWGPRNNAECEVIVTEIIPWFEVRFAF